MKHRKSIYLFSVFCSFFFAVSIYGFQLYSGEHFVVREGFEEYILKESRDLKSYFETGGIISTYSLLAFAGHQLTNSDGAYSPKIRYLKPGKFEVIYCTRPDLKLSFSNSITINTPGSLYIDQNFENLYGHPTKGHPTKILNANISAFCPEEHKKSITIVDESEVNAKFDTIEKKISNITGNTKLYQEIKAQVKKELLDEFRNGELKRLKAEIVQEVVRSLKGVKDEL